MNASVADRSALRLPFDRYQRYAFAARAIEVLGGTRLLEVGASTHGDLDRFTAPARIVRLDRARPAGEPLDRFVQGDGASLPFRDRAFDVVVALDVLEHVPAERRGRFLAELLRVAARGVVVAAPFHSAAVEAEEARLADYFRDLHGVDFPWLAEHAAQGLPVLDETVGHIRALGWATVAWGAGNLALWAKLMGAHLYVNSEPGLLELRGRFDELYNRELAARDRTPPVYRHFIACAPSGAALAELERSLGEAAGDVSASDLLRVQELLDDLHAAGSRERARRARAAAELEGAERAADAARHGEALAEREARIAGLEAKAREKDAALAEVERLHELRARLEAALAEHDDRERAAARRRRLFRETVSTGLRLLGAAAAATRAAGRLWLSRRHAMRLEPIHDLAVEGDEFRSLGDDPQFELHSSRRRLPRSWVVVSFAVEPRGQWLSPKLYVDDGRGFSEDRSFALPVRAGRRVECIVGLPANVRALRLDPLAAPGRFVLSDVAIREIGLVQLLAAVLPHVGAVPVRPRELARLAGLALGSLRSGGWRSIVHGLLARDREASDYQDWIDAYDTFGDTDRALVRRHAATLARRPLISIVMPVYETPEPWLRRAIDSVLAQLYDDWELCMADDASVQPHVRRVLEEYRARDGRIKVVYRPERGHISAASNSALELATGDYVALLDHDDELSERALYMVAVELDAHPAAEIVYSDEDKITAQSRRFDPYFKPDWNRDLFLAQNLVTHLCVCRTARVRAVGGFRTGYEGAQDWDLVMRLSEDLAAERICHIPHVLYHWRAVRGSTALAIGEKGYASAAQYRTLAAHFERRGEAVKLLPVAGLCWRVRYPLERPAPLVSVIIPTRDHAALLRRCIASLRRRTVYPNLEIVVVDNQSRELTALAALEELAAEPDVTVVRYDAPFNYSAINNLAARTARGEVLALLNNDVEAITPGWLEEMVSQACRPEIGAVGAMLYYPNDTIQHAGVILGLGTSGIAAHAYVHRPRGHVGQIGRALLAQNVSAVTAACLVVRREVFEEVGGFDEVHLSIAYNDLDLCLRIGDRGYLNLWTPHAELYHRESASRGYEDTAAKRQRFQREADYIRRRWGERLRADPAYNPNLSVDGESFALAFPPRTCKPWLDAAEEAAPARALGRA